MGVFTKVLLSSLLSITFALAQIAEIPFEFQNDIILIPVRINENQKNQTQIKATFINFYLLTFKIFS